MPRFLSLYDNRRRDARVEVSGPAQPPRRSFVAAADRRPIRSARLIKVTEGHDLAALQRQWPDPEALARALVAGDPELDIEKVGQRVGTTNQVWVSADGKILYAAHALRVTDGPLGNEISREEFVDVEATVQEDVALPWTGRLLTAEEVVRRFALVQKLQLRHINGLTFDFLFEIARTLQESGKLLRVQAAKGGALIFQRNGTGYYGFLEGRVEGEGFRLVLHLSNFELKPLPRGEA